jgi:hypothetical protein
LAQLRPRCFRSRRSIVRDTNCVSIEPAARAIGGGIDLRIGSAAIRINPRGEAQESQAAAR